MKNILYFSSVLFILFIIRCGLVEPEISTGSLTIQLVTEEENTGMQKAAATDLSSVRCVLKKGSTTVTDKNLTHSGNSYTATIDNLEEGSDYSVVLYGKNSSGDVIARAYDSYISIKAGKTTTATTSWKSFCPSLSSPGDGTTIDDDTPKLECDWSYVSGADEYKLEVDDYDSFLTPVIEVETSSTIYTASSLSDGKYYWRVCSKDDDGVWGDWSEVWDFTISTTTGTMTDIDGNVYQTVKIGDQWWMAENLKVTHYRNGSSILHYTSDSDWTSTTSGAYCAYDNDEDNAETYGYLYNWYAVDDYRNIAPSGWHVPTDEEWKELEMYLGMSQSEADDDEWRGTNEGSKLAGDATLWREGDLVNNAAFAESGFGAIPTGNRDYSDGDFEYIGLYDYFWSATEYNNDYAWRRTLRYNNSKVYRYYRSKRYGFSVRLVKD